MQYFVVGIIGPIYYFLLLTTLGRMWSGYNPILQSMSEIGSVTSPYKDMMNYAGFAVLGIVMLLFGVGLWRMLGRGALQHLTSILVGIAGVFMFAVGFLPCDAGCIDVTQTGRLHSITSTVPSITLPLAAMVMATTITKKWGKKWGYISFWLGVLSMAAGPIMFVPQSTLYLGMIQRIGIGLSLLWMILISIKSISVELVRKRAYWQ